MPAEFKRGRRIARSVPGQLMLIAACLVVLIPCYFLVLGAFKTVPEFFSAPFSPPESWAFRNFHDAWEQADLLIAFRNSVLITAASVFLGTACACLAAHAIARMTRGASLVQMLFVAGMVLPTQLVVIAAFVEMRWLGLVGTVWPVIILYAVYGLPLGVLLLVGFFRRLPPQLREAAAIDGAGEWRQFLFIVLPLARIPIFTVAMLNSVWIWNDFFVPLIFANNESLQTVPLAILNFYGENTTNYGLVFAGVVMSALPVLGVYILMTRQFINGVVAGAIKG
ncbi:carbohydrate ABC transporter permease [Actinomadura mexicana]|uniref:Raffinose/stachyose/melibiose transport system permease protein n=1 Tax=Actinomadura mexicana TaxID=134959 RepID=A0A238XFC2_9ACTN|nr:carbohydrate ABC transporter permease [Actinomadura mexicana]SNR57308.1 raffinose/stachyose/melibiose transport system permease protein [Actinomadura mexicana]